MKIKKISEAIGLKAYTDLGEFFGEIEEASLVENKIAGWRIKVSGKVSQTLGGARGVVIPHNFVKAVENVFIVSHASLPLDKEPTDLLGEDKELM
jgi:sporulation protein YlmC with PRC-barrel domain